MPQPRRGKPDTFSGLEMPGCSLMIILFVILVYIFVRYA